LGGGFAAIPNSRWYFLIYAGFAIPIIMFLLYRFDIAMWSGYGINYVFILGLNPRDYLNAYEFGEMVSLMFFLLCTCVYLTFDNWLYPLIHAEWYPMILLVMILLIMFNPLNMFYKSARFWLLKSLGRIITPGMTTVEFRDNFLTDGLVSMSYSFTAGATFICAYKHHWTDLDQKCNLSKAWLVPFLTSIPNTLRFIQCLRRVYDTRQPTDHLINAGKYFVSTCVINLSFLFKVYGTNNFRAAWILVAFFSTMYSLFWDFRKDWGILNPTSKNSLLREFVFCPLPRDLLSSELAYPEWYYYVCMGVNVLLRITFLLVISPSLWSSLGIDGALIAFILAILEVVRRIMWATIRMENEHSNNSSQFRVANDIPLPFAVQEANSVPVGNDYDSE
jgi:hypothetical protein